jgi:eukaryotic-like serine/threonine-protein kinase
LTCSGYFHRIYIANKINGLILIIRGRSTRMPNLVGRRLGNYRLTRSLGRGGFAEVYLGEHVFLKTQAAIKVLNIQLARDDLESFVTEARNIASLVHPHIIRVLEFGVEGDEFEVENRIPYLVMDYAPNGTLRQRHPKGTRLPLTTILPYVKNIVEALHYAHLKRLVHRDVKPENMLLNANNEALLSDFGIALVSSTSSSQTMQTTAGTVAYMAPEQVMGKPGPASDQYALGIVVYEWLCGERPFYGSFSEIATQQMLAPPPPLRTKVPGITSDVEAVLLTALNKDPQRRFKNMLAFANALEHASKSEPPLLSSSAFIPTLPTAPSAPDSPGTYASTLHMAETPGTPTTTPPIAGSVPTPRLSDSALTPPITDPTFISPSSNPTFISRLSDPTISAPFVPPITSLAPAQPPVPTVAGTPQAPSLPTVAGTPPRVSWLRTVPISRRTFVTGAAGAVVVGGGIVAWLVSHMGSTRTSASGVGTLLRTYHGHTDGVTAVSWSPNGEHIASGSNDHTVQVWDATNGATLLTHRNYSGGVAAVSWSPESILIASASSGASVSGGPAGDTLVQVWNTSTGKSVFTYRGHSGAVTAVSWSPKAERIASSSVDYTVQVWDATTGRHPLIYRTHSWYLLTVAWSPDGTRIASGGPDGTVQVWDTTTGKPLHTFRGHTDGVESVAWSPDGNLIASASDDYTVRVWDATTGNTLHILSGHSSYVRSVIWSPAGRYIASASNDRTAQMWDATTGKTVFTYRGHSGGVTALAWSPDGKRIASGSSDKTVQVWKAT